MYISISLYDSHSIDNDIITVARHVYLLCIYTYLHIYVHALYRVIFLSITDKEWKLHKLYLCQVHLFTAQLIVHEHPVSLLQHLLCFDLYTQCMCVHVFLQSSYFASMFSGNWKESGDSRISLDIPDPNITTEGIFNLCPVHVLQFIQPTLIVLVHVHVPVSYLCMCMYSVHL